jgi:hypothetical protein
MIGDTLAQIALTVMSGGNPTLAVMYGAAKGGSDTGSWLGAGLGGLSGLGTGMGTGSFMRGVSAAGGGLGGAASYVGSGIRGIANNLLNPIDFLTRTGTGLANSVSSGITSLGHGIQNAGNALLHPIDTLANVGTAIRQGAGDLVFGNPMRDINLPAISNINELMPSDIANRAITTAGDLANPITNINRFYAPDIQNRAITSASDLATTVDNVNQYMPADIQARAGVSGTHISPTTGSANGRDKIQRALDLAGDLTKPGTPTAPITSVSMPNTSANLAASLNPITYTPFSNNMAKKFISPAILAAAADKDPMAMAAVSAAARSAIPLQADKSSAGLFGLDLNAEGGADLGLGGSGLRGLGFAYGGSIEDIKDPMNPMGGTPASQYGLASLEQGGTAEDAPVEGYLNGPGDGMSDSIKATIDGKQPARLADGEFVIPADVVSGLGNGSSKAGAKVLYAMMDRVRQARTGNPKQGKEINAEKFLPA